MQPQAGIAVNCLPSGYSGFLGLLTLGLTAKAAIAEATTFPLVTFYAKSDPGHFFWFRLLARMVLFVRPWHRDCTGRQSSGGLLGWEAVITWL